MSKFEVKAFSAYNIDEATRCSSSSGGVFSLFAEKVIDSGGVVYGVGMSDDCYSAEYVRVKDIQEIGKLRGSKYVQARINDSFTHIREDLDNGINVLFSGTGCQVNGLKSFLGKEYKNLFCVDVVCHGVPSQQLWKKYVDHHEGRYGKISSVNFRCTDKNLKAYKMKKNYLFIPKTKDSYFKFFLRDFCLRPSCYECKAKSNKKSDISLADFWGINRVLPEMNDNKGVSLVLVRTEKGEELFKACEGQLRYKNVDYSNAIQYNPAESYSVRRPDQRKSFYADLNHYEYEEIIKMYTPSTKAERIDGVTQVCKKAVKRIMNALHIMLWGNEAFDFTSDYGILLIFERTNNK